MISPQLLRHAEAIQEYVAYRMVGRMGDPARNTAALSAAFAYMAGGPHVEIGVLYGGSLIVTALLFKNESVGDYPRKVVIGVDPLDGYYVGQRRVVEGEELNVPNERMSLPISIDTLHENMSRFGVTDLAEVVVAKSHPWPAELKGRKFASAFIDGNHWGGMPYLDFLNLKDRVGQYMVFDNAPDGTKHGSDAVGRALDRIEKYHPEWNRVFQDGAFVALEKNGTEENHG